MSVVKHIETVFVGVIPGKKTPSGIPFRTDIGGSYCVHIETAERICRLNGGRQCYFFIEERYLINYPGTRKKSRIGNIKQIHHYNKTDNEKTERKIDPNDILASIIAHAAKWAFKVVFTFHTHKGGNDKRHDSSNEQPRGYLERPD